MIEADARVERAFTEHARVLQATRSLEAEVVRAARLVAEAMRLGRTVLTCGNGGSAADASHIEAELVGRFLLTREPWPVIDLGSNSALMTALANDFGYDDVFSRQVHAHASGAGCLIAISTSGNSRNVVNAAQVARGNGMPVIGLTGEGGGELGSLCEILLAVPTKETPRIQEMHILLIHLLCEIVEAELAAQRS